ncbi:C39 family peptidase [Nannocystis radixulma]|uniref:C39 family peptidase n=1 Tax=Nannocystis radixulma TaxID=2995305 RepID=A0ABT5B8H4_9BACT|nr:C39 family peptidase [Nannocystis radixulma]MDC0670419.1 C39 family peptidase [Nannocystis radixulma]
MTPAPGPAGPTSEALRRLEALHERGLFVQAFRAAEAIAGGPLAWRDPDACAFASRLLQHVGAPRAAALQCLRAYRAAPRDPEVAEAYARHLKGTRGPLAALEFLRTFAVDAAPAPAQCELRLVRALALIALRDFEAAEFELCRAEALDPTSPTIAGVRARLHEAQDELPAALAGLQELLAARPDHRAAVQFAGHLLLELGRVDEAAALLATAMTTMECGAIALQLAHLELTRQRPREAWDWVVRAAGLFPWLEVEVLQALAAAACEAACEAGERLAAAALARNAGLDGLAERLEAGGERQRVRLDVPYVRQAHKTCVPATLTALCQFFGKTADHLAIAEEICFDGTSAASERRWAEERGFIVREFTVTWAAATALLDRGLPFALSTVAVTSGHAQAVTGYDAEIGSFSVRDPSQAKPVLFNVEPLLRGNAWNGPRGMVLVPPELAGRLDGLELPDAALYDRMHAVDQALRVHDREAAVAAAAEIAAAAPKHYLVGHAAQALAAYDGDEARVLASLDMRLETWPDAHVLQARKLACLGGLGQRAERRARLEAMAEERPVHPFFLQLLVDDILKSDRDLGRAEKLLRRLLWAMPADPVVYAMLAGVRAAQDRWEEGASLLRFAVCLDQVDSDAVDQYTATFVQAGQRAEGLAFLRDRFARLGRRFAGPALGLARALEACDRTAEAVEVLEQAVALRPDDAHLLLAAVRAHASLGATERARALLEQARPLARAAAWETAAAHLDALAGELAAARARHERVLEHNPLALEARVALAGLDAALAGPAAALERIEAAVARFPHHAGLARLRVAWAPAEGEAGVEVVRALLAVEPGNAGMHGELALRLGRLKRHDEAAAAIAQARALAPHSAQTHLVAAQLAMWREEREVAAASLRAAVSADVDAPGAIAVCLGTALTEAARAAALAHVRAELRRQVVGAHALVAYRHAAAGIEPPEATLELLAEARAVRPDLAASWSEYARQLSSMGRHAEALAVMTEAARRFPREHDAMLALAAVQRGAGEREAALATLERAVACAPGAVAPVLELASALVEADQVRRAVELVERAIAREPLVVELSEKLADLLWRSGEQQAALDRLLAAIEIEPSSEARWRQIERVADLLGMREHALAAARKLAAARPQLAWAHFGVARLAPEAAIDERLAAYDEVLRLDPHNGVAHDDKVLLFCAAERWKEALAACSPPELGSPPPLNLRGRAVWIRARRDIHKGIRQMQELVAEEPGYAFGWSCLAEWYRQVEAGQKHAEALAQLLRLDPDNLEVAQALFAVQLHASATPAAEQTLATLRRLGDADVAREAELRFALARGPNHGLQLFAAHARDATIEREWLEHVAALVRDRVTEAQLDRTLTELLRAPAAAAVVGYLWGWYRVAGPLDWLLASWELRSLRARGAVGLEATSGHVERLAAEGSTLALWLFIARDRAALRVDGRVWGSVGFALLRRGWVGQARKWFEGWASRDDLEPWVYMHIATVLRTLGITQEAHVVSSLAVERLPRHQTLRHRLWLAFDAAPHAPVEEVRSSLPALADGDPLNHWLLHRSRALLARREGRPQAEVDRLTQLSEQCRLRHFEVRLVERLRADLAASLASATRAALAAS